MLAVDEDLRDRAVAAARRYLAAAVLVGHDVDLVKSAPCWASSFFAR